MIASKLRTPRTALALAGSIAITAMPARADGTLACIGARHGNHWTYLGGARAAPYECTIGQRTVKIEADRIYFDPGDRVMGDLDKTDPKQAKTFRESNFRWTWAP